jgi:hypothetical protein
MLYSISKPVAVFYQHAYECNEKARKARDSEEREFYLDMERRWLSLAHHRDLTERLTRDTKDSRAKAAEALEPLLRAGCQARTSFQQ